MLDLKFVLKNLDEVEAGLKKRNADHLLTEIKVLAEKSKSLRSQFEELRAHQNKSSKLIQEKKTQGDPADELLAEMKELSAKIKIINSDLDQAEEALNQALQVIPNLPDASVPEGKDENDNKVVRTVGQAPDFSFEPLNHWDIGENLGILDFERASKITGARFTLYRGAGAKLERALINFMLDQHSQKNGYEEVLPPFLVNAQSLFGTGQLPKFEKDLFKTEEGFYLIPTAEVPVTNIFQDEILREQDLPISFCAYTPCFRSEAGSHGKDVRGLIRQHQFNKVELVKFTKPEDSAAEHEKLTADAEGVLQALGLHYRVVSLCSGDLGFSSQKTYDLEVWLPGQNTYREISSCSNFGDFQARRAKIRYKSKDKQNILVHTLNGSGLAVGRTLVAILENYQNEDGSVSIPAILQPYMNGQSLIKKS